MKNTYLILIILSVFTGCNEEKVRHQENSIFGKWSLIRYEAGFSPTEDFSNGEVIWLFKQPNKLKVETHNTMSSPIKLIGQYEFSLNKNIINIDNSKYDFLITENTLVISNDPSADGFIATFSKVNQ